MDELAALVRSCLEHPRDHQRRRDLADWLVFGFVRRLGDLEAVVAVPRLLTRLVSGPEGLPLGAEVWQDTRLLLPDSAPAPPWYNLFTGETLTCVDQQGQPALSLAEVLGHFPVALLLARDKAPPEETLPAETSPHTEARRLRAAYNNAEPEPRSVSHR